MIIVELEIRFRQSGIKLVRVLLLKREPCFKSRIFVDAVARARIVIELRSAHVSDDWSYAYDSVAIVEQASEHLSGTRLRLLSDKIRELHLSGFS